MAYDLFLILILVFFPSTLAIPARYLDSNGNPFWFKVKLYACNGCYRFRDTYKNQKKQYELSYNANDQREIYWTGSAWTFYKPNNNIHWKKCSKSNLFECPYLRWTINVNGADGAYVYAEQYNGNPAYTRTDENFYVFYDTSNSKWKVSDSLGGATTYATCSKSNFFECDFVSTGSNCDYIPTNNPSMLPSRNPSNSPSFNPTKSPSKNPSHNPTFSPSSNPSKNPSENPSFNPTKSPSENPSHNPTFSPSFNPIATKSPSENPSANPTLSPTNVLQYTSTNYIGVAKLLNTNDANTFCETEFNSNLATVLSKNDVHEIENDILQTMYNDTSRHVVHFGYRDFSGHAKWLDGHCDATNTLNAQWHSNADSTHKNQCGFFNLFYSTHWDIGACALRRYFICNNPNGKYKNPIC